MALPTPEEAAANRARLNTKPAGAVVIPAPYDLIDITGQQIARGTAVWRYVSGRQYGGPGEMSMFNQQPGGKPLEYSYRSLESAARMGWKE